MTVTHSGGNTSLMILSMQSAVFGASSEGFTTTVLPAAIAPNQGRKHKLKWIVPGADVQHYTIGFRDNKVFRGPI